VRAPAAPIPIATLAPDVPFPELSPSSVWSTGHWIARHWPVSAPAERQPEVLRQAAEEHQAQTPRRPEGDLEKSDFPAVAPMSEPVRSKETIDFFQAGDDITPLLGDFGGDSAEGPLSAFTGAPLNTTIGAPLNTVTGGPLNTLTGGPLNTVTGGPLNTVTRGPLMTVQGGPIMVTTGNPMVSRRPNYPLLVPQGPAMTAQARRSR
jgi:hypothetical protein